MSDIKSQNERDKYSPLLESDSSSLSDRQYGSLKLSGRLNNKSVNISVDSLSAVQIGKHLTLLHAVGLILTNVIGSGIFVSAQGVAAAAGSPGLTLCLWALCGLHPIGLGLCYAELGTVVPKSGGEYTFIHEILGPLPAFVTGWIIIFVSTPSTVAVNAQTAALYLSIALGVSCENKTLITLISLTVIMVVVALNCVSVVGSSRLVTGVSAAKITSLVGIIITGVVLLSQGNTKHISQGFEGTNTDTGIVIGGLLNCIFAYKGWEVIAIVSEEIVNPKRNLPLSLVLATCITCVVYVLTNMSYLTSMSFTDMANSPAIAVTFSAKAVGVAAAYVVAILVALCCIGTVTSSILTKSRLVLVAGRNGHAPASAAMLQTTARSPIIGIMTNGVIASCYLALPSLDMLIQISALGTLLKQLICMVALCIHRYRHRNEARPIKVPLLAVVVCLLVVLSLVVLSVYSQPLVLGSVTMCCILGIPAYFICQELHKNTAAQRVSGKLTKLLQILFLIIPESPPKPD